MVIQPGRLMLLEYILLINFAGTINSNYGNICAYVIKQPGGYNFRLPGCVIPGYTVISFLLAC